MTKFSYALETESVEGGISGRPIYNSNDGKYLITEWNFTRRVYDRNSGKLKSTSVIDDRRTYCAFENSQYGDFANKNYDSSDKEAKLIISNPDFSIRSEFHFSAGDKRYFNSFCASKIKMAFLQNHRESDWFYDENIIENRELSLYDSNTEMISTIKLPKDLWRAYVYDVSILEDKNLLAIYAQHLVPKFYPSTPAEFGTVTFIDLKTGLIKGVIDMFQTDHAPKINFYGSYLVINGQTVFNVADNRKIIELKNTQDEISYIKVLNKSQKIIAVVADQYKKRNTKVIAFDLNGTQLYEYVKDYNLWAFDISNNERYLALNLMFGADYNYGYYIFDLDTGKQIKFHKDPGATSREYLQFSPDSLTIQIINYTDGEKLLKLPVGE